MDMAYLLASISFSAIGGWFLGVLLSILWPASVANSPSPDSVGIREADEQNLLTGETVK